MKLTILFHFQQHTETVSVNTDLLSPFLHHKIVNSLHKKERLTLSFDSFSSIKSSQRKKGFKKFASIIGINVSL